MVKDRGQNAVLTDEQIRDAKTGMTYENYAKIQKHQENRTLAKLTVKK